MDNLIKFKDLSIQSQKKLLNCGYHETVKKVFPVFSKVIQDELVLKNRLIQHPLNSWSKEERKTMVEIIECHTGESALNHIVKRLITNLEPKERVIPIRWNSDWDPNRFIATEKINGMEYDFNFLIPESLAMQIGFFVSNWNNALNEKRLNGYEI